MQIDADQHAVARHGARFEWAVVEVMGHSVYSGIVSEAVIGGCHFVRVDVPATSEHEPFTKLLGAGAIFAITPCSEGAARAVAESCHARPIAIYAPQMQRLLDYDDE